MVMMDVLERISDTVWEIPVSYKEGMHVPARIYGTQKLIQDMDDGVYDQVTVPLNRGWQKKRAVLIKMLMM